MSVGDFRRLMLQSMFGISRSLVISMKIAKVKSCVFLKVWKQNTKRHPGGILKGEFLPAEGGWPRGLLGSFLTLTGYQPMTSVRRREQGMSACEIEMRGTVAE